MALLDQGDLLLAFHRTDMSEPVTAALRNGYRTLSHWLSWALFSGTEGIHCG
jgi:hypothetical protein